jgi:hypothetical protein
MATAVDFETFFSKKLKYGLKQMIAEQYCRHDLFDCYLLSVSDGTACWAGHPKDFNWASLDGQVLLSHNRYFDSTVFNELVRRGLAPKLNIPAWHCTANLTSYICNRRDLKGSVEYLFKASVSKDYRTVADGKHWPYDYSADEIAQVIEAGRADAHWCWRLWDTYGPQWPEMERRLSDLTIRQGMRGVQINTDLLEDYIIWSHEMRCNIEREIPWMKGAADGDAEAENDWEGFKTKPTSTKCIAEQCRRSRIPCPPVKSDDEEGYEEWETQFAKDHKWIYAVSAWRSCQKLYTTFLTIRERLRPDGTLPFALKYFGGHTGRWSGDAKVNFQNMRKKPALMNEHGMLEVNEKRISAALKQHSEEGTWPDWVRHAIDFRALVIPRPGSKMIISDLSQIEPRVLAWLGNNTALLKLIREGYGVYEAFARTSMGYTGPRFDKAFKQTDYYKMLKIQVLGLGYGAGWEKFINIAWNEGGIDLTEKDPEWLEEDDPFSTGTRKVSGFGHTSKGIVNNFRESSPRITELWKKLDSKLKASVSDNLDLFLPSNRRMRYEAVKCERRIVRDKKTGKPSYKDEYTADVGGKRRTFYGGKLTENLVQATARDVFGEQLLRLEDLGWTSLFTVHDEVILEVDSSVTAKDVEREMSFCPEWISGLPVAAEAQEVTHYQK